MGGSCSSIDVTSIRCMSVEPEIQCYQCSFKNWGTKQFERLCFVCTEIRSCYPNGYNESGWGVCEFKRAGERLINAVNAIGRKNDVYVAKQRLFIHVSGVGHIQRTYSAEIRYLQSCYSLFTYRKRKDKDVIKQKSYEEILNDFMTKN